VPLGRVDLADEVPITREVEQAHPVADNQDAHVCLMSVDAAVRESANCCRGRCEGAELCPPGGPSGSGVSPSGEPSRVDGLELSALDHLLGHALFERPLLVGGRLTVLLNLDACGLPGCPVAGNASAQRDNAET
jgi:hypothetical protein